LAFQNMMAELRGAVPVLPFSYTGTLINRAWGVIRDSDIWSFQLYESSWRSPQVVTTGTVTVVLGSDTVQFDATAVAAINASQLACPTSLITQRQLRPGSSSGVSQIYNLIQYDEITLDRTYYDNSGTDISYQLYQLYYPAQFQDHKTWISVRNMSMYMWLGVTMERAELDMIDPQRSIYQFPSQVVPYMIDARGQGTDNASATLGFPLFELWGQPVNPFVYATYGRRRGDDLVNPTDALPIQVGEDCVLARARMYVYEWAEANKAKHPELQGPDYRFLMGAAAAEYKDRMTKYRQQDKDFVDAWFSIRGINWMGQNYGAYNTQLGVSTVYGGNY